MLKHHLLTILRQLNKRRLYAGISLLSLTVGLTVFCLIVLHVRHELSFNAGWPEAERIYRLTHKQGGTGATLPPSQGFSPEFTLNITNYIGDFVDAYAEVTSLSSLIEDIDSEQGLQLKIVEPPFLEIFQPPVLAGSLETVMQAPGFIALERAAAERLYGSVDAAMGKTIELSGARVIFSVPGFQPGQPTSFEVAAVFEQPETVSSATRLESLAPKNDYSLNLFPSVQGIRNLGLNLWVKLPEGMDPETVNTQLDRYLDEYLITTRTNTELRGGTYSELFDFKLQPLSDVYFSQGMNEFPNGDRTRLLTFGVVALLVLVAGSSNVVSLGLAAAMERRREIGIRKAVGALQQSVMAQFIGEALVLSLLALVPTVALVHLLHGAFANLLSITSMPDPGLVEIALMTAICVSVGLLNGLYPALVLARVKPVAVLKAGSVHSRMRRFNLRGLLVMAQFCFSVVLLVVTLGLYVQLWVTRNQPLGFDVDNLAVASVNFDMLRTRPDLGPVFANELATVPGISASSPILSMPGRANEGPPTMALVNTQQDAEGVPIKSMAFKPGLFELLGIPLLAGRDLDPVSDLVRPPEPAAQPTPPTTPPLRRALINRSALNALGFTDPLVAVGKTYYLLSDTGARRSYTPFEVIGVVEDSMLASVRERTGAEFYYLEGFGGGNVLFRYDAAAAADIQERVNAVAQEVTGAPTQTVFIDDRIAEAFTEEQRESRLLLMCAGLALFLSCVGLYGLVSVALKTQVKEIGVRKVLGASTLSVVKTFLSRFSVPVLLANLIAWPVAAYSSGSSAFRINSTKPGWCRSASAPPCWCC